MPAKASRVMFICDDSCEINVCGFRVTSFIYLMGKYTVNRLLGLCKLVYQVLCVKPCSYVCFGTVGMPLTGHVLAVGNYSAILFSCTFCDAHPPCLETHIKHKNLPSLTGTILNSVLDLCHVIIVITRAPQLLLQYMAGCLSTS